MRAILFYPLVALAAAALIAASFGPTLSPLRPAPQAGRSLKDSVVFDARSLSHLEPGPDQVLYVSRDDFWRPTGVQIATKRPETAPGPSKTGARLQLDPATARQFAGRAIDVRVLVRPVPVTTAPEIAVSAEGPGPIAWRRQKLPSENAALSFRFPAIEGAAPSAIGFWPVATGADYNYGVEIVEVRLSAAP